MTLLKDLGLRKPTPTSSYNKRFGLYLCECGNTFETQIGHVKSGNTTSCGCVKLENARKASTTHALSKHALYSVWLDMKKRVNTKKVKYKISYTDKNITICDDWKNNFQSFYDWSLLNGYEESLSIDRIDNDLGYSPDNCRWTSMSTQCQNTRLLRSNNKSGYRGVSYAKRENKWTASILDNGVKTNFGYFSTALEAATAYNNYVITNKSHHPLNILEE
jgi:hypothetical protein